MHIIALVQAYHLCLYQMVGFLFTWAGNQMLASPAGSCASQVPVLQLTSE